MKTIYQPQEIARMLEQFTTSCREAGLKVTHQRSEIYRSLLTNPDHPSAESIHKRILTNLPTISLDTVYRTLSTLESYGFVSRIQTSESQARFEAVINPHHHLICSNCKTVMDFVWPELDSIKAPDFVEGWGNIRSRNLVMYGVCNNCSS